MNDEPLSPGTLPLIQALKRALRREGITYAQLAPQMGLSEASVKRLFSLGRFSLKQVLQVCDAAGTDLAEISRGSRVSRESARELTLGQERALAADPRLLLLFHLLGANWSLAEIARRYALRGPERTLLLVRLDRLGLIDLLPRERFRFRVPRDYTWRSNGPVRRRYGAQVLREFLLDDFTGEHALLRFQAVELGQASMQVLRKKLERIAVEAHELAELDAGLAAARKRSVGIALAMRPWVFSIASALEAEAATMQDAER